MNIREVKMPAGVKHPFHADFRYEVLAHDGGGWMSWSTHRTPEAATRRAQKVERQNGWHALAYDTWTGEAVWWSWMEED